MKKELFRGAGVAIVTPFKEDNSVNYEKLDELVEYQIQNQTDAIIVCGTTGESPTLSHDEHCEVIKRVIYKTNKRVPVIAGTGSNDTNYAIFLSKEAENMGADGVLVVTPYYNKASQLGLLAHYTKIADSINIPLIIYDIPSRTGCKISIDTFYKLSKHENIVGVKCASGDISQVIEIKEKCKDNFHLYSGNDDQIVPLLSVGGIGVISVLSNILPKQTHDICDLYLNGDVSRSRDLQLEYLDLIHKLFIDVNPIPIKEAMNFMGMEVGECRMPLCGLDKDKRETLKETLKKYKLI